MNNKKFGIMGYNTLNIGDDIQSVVTSTLLKINYIVLRDNFEMIYDYDTGKLVTNLEEDIYLIMNGWFMHDSKGNYTCRNFKFPFTHKHIIPIYISCCFPVSFNELYDENVIKHFKENEIIYTRDKDTMKKLKIYGVNSIFYGCLTQVLNKDSIPDNDDYKKKYSNCIFKVDSDIKILDKDSEVVEINHYINQLKEMNPKKRIEYAKDLLSKYKYARKIYTSRLHCFLPCRAMGIDVVYTGEINYRSKDLINIIPNKEEMIKLFYNIVKLKTENQ